ncbi:MAG: outer membrane protein assembly factor BamD [Methylococcales bacterium]
MFVLKNIFLLLLVIGLSGCNTFSGVLDEKKDKYEGWSVEKFYTEAKDASKSENYEKAIRLYEILESRYPFGSYAAQAQLDVAYAYYKYDEPESAIAAADRFIKIHPLNPHVDYAYYLKGLVNYNRGIGFLERFFPTDSSQRDPGSARDALQDFSLLRQKFPDSRYHEDSGQRIIALKNNLAMYEIHVARYYMKRKAYVAVVDRGNYVIENYPRTQAIPLALELMRKAYNKMGLTNLTAGVVRVYDYNYAEGIPYSDEINQRDTTLAEDIWEFIGLDE